ncbi:hypothetical protein Mycsm_07008 (plasmid) [Mycobacterium sp. JS623]|uniref:hypothetical protein n=1 Tax=Mycobacterium sp. JS623 TaxID=212767 RepID=UPI0002A58D62|nr:hypothetical protein [Mycobacterium sp. JS623]AGB27109.1 hypothetical protein Mycsm_07008 [Mycobacterium sp. JS623]
MTKGRRPRSVVGGCGLLALAATVAVIGARLPAGGAGPLLTRYAAIAGIVGVVWLLLAFLDRRHQPAQAYFYVSAIQDGRAVLVTGPYATRDLAAGDIARVRGALAEHGSLDRAYSWGVSESPDRFDGLANAELGFQPA